MKLILELIKCLRQGNTPWTKIDELLELPPDGARSKARSQDWYKQIVQRNPHDKAEDVDKKNYRDDGSISSFIRTRLDDKQTFSKEELLELHGLDPKEFKIKTITSNEWSMTNGEGEKHYNFQSKILAEPLSSKDITFEQIAELLNELQPKKIELRVDELPKEYLFVGLSDMHLMFNKYDKLQSDIADVMLNGYEEILMSVHGDLFHVDNFLNTTERGTRVDDVDFERGVQDGFRFIMPLIERALECSPTVKLVYLPGNHAPSVDYMFMQAIKRLYPDVEVDDSVDDFKHAWLGNHSIFMHHGDKVKNPKRLLEIIVSKFAKEWGESQSRYLMTGHFHHEKTLSFAGMTHYQVMSPSKQSSYDKQMGYVDSETGLMLFTFDEEKRRRVDYL